MANTPKVFARLFSKGGAVEARSLVARRNERKLLSALSFCERETLASPILIAPSFSREKAEKSLSQKHP